MLEYAAVLCVAAIVTFFSTPAVRWVAIKVRAMSPIRDRDVHTIPTPRLGGVAVLLGLIAAIAVAHQLPGLRQTFVGSSESTAVLVAGGLICLLGALDDRYDLEPLTKLAGQIASSGVVVLMGVQLAFIFIPYSGLGTISLDPNTSFLLTTLIIVGAVNAMNFIDGLDGLLAGVAVIAAVAFFVYSYYLSLQGRGDVFSAPSLMTAALAGACLGFLPHNFNPARIFLGDSGSMLIGLVLASAAISSTSHADPQSFNVAVSALPLFMPLIIPLAILAIPVLDMTLAIVRRARERRSPFSPDKMHLHHRLLEIGHTQRRAVLILYFWSALIAFTGVGVAIGRGSLVLWLSSALVVVAITVSVIPRLRRRNQRAPHA